MQVTTSVAVVGASGYAGGELLRLVAGHPGLRLVAASAHSNAGEPVRSVHPQLVSAAGLDFADSTPEAVGDAELVFLALPHGASGEFAARLDPAQKIVDLGADHRLTDAGVHQRYYGGRHAGAWTYGLPELPGQRDLIAGSDRVANTGCYAVAVIAALAPVLAAGLGRRDDVVVVAASGTSGAGRGAKVNLLGSQVMGDLSGYRVGAHQHVPEIKQASGATGLAMTPILAPMPRGILASVNIAPSGTCTPEDVREVLDGAYAAEPFVHVLPPGEQPHTSATLGSNSVHLQGAVDVDSGRVIVISAIDNLGKGAAGQAMQNANIMLGLPETAGLSADGIAP